MSLDPLSVPEQVAFTHRAAYVDPASRRPVVDIEFAATNHEGVLLGAFTTGVLVDSGARNTILRQRDAVSLGLDLSDPERYPREDARGIAPGGPPMSTAQAVLKALICDRWLDIPVGFALTNWPVTRVLGREGVFDQVLLAFPHGERALLGRG